MRTQEDVVMRASPSWKVRLLRSIRELGSHSAIVAMLPGSSLLALSLLMLRHRAWLAAHARRVLSGIVAFGVGFISHAEMIRCRARFTLGFHRK